MQYTTLKRGTPEYKVIVGICKKYMKQLVKAKKLLRKRDGSNGIVYLDNKVLLNKSATKEFKRQKYPLDSYGSTQDGYSTMSVDYYSYTIGIMISYLHYLMLENYPKVNMVNSFTTYRDIIKLPNTRLIDNKTFFNSDNAPFVNFQHKVYSEFMKSELPEDIKRRFSTPFNVLHIYRAHD